jgi:hypothetical protein
VCECERRGIETRFAKLAACFSSPVDGAEFASFAFCNLVLLFLDSPFLFLLHLKRIETLNVSEIAYD